jgi:hypothetical protein
MEHPQVHTFYKVIVVRVCMLSVQSEGLASKKTSSTTQSLLMISRFEAKSGDCIYLGPDPQLDGGGNYVLAEVRDAIGTAQNAPYSKN